jgi:hypothetical protein
VREKIKKKNEMVSQLTKAKNFGLEKVAVTKDIEDKAREMEYKSDMAKQKME